MGSVFIAGKSKKQKNKSTIHMKTVKPVTNQFWQY